MLGRNEREMEKEEDNRELGIREKRVLERKKDGEEERIEYKVLEIIFR